MKKALFMALLIPAVAVSCNIEPLQDTLETALTEQQIVIEAVHDDYDGDTKTVRNEDGSVSWQAGDQISLFFGSGSNGGSAFTTTDSGKTASFTGTIGAFTAGGEDFDGGMTYFWGLYPYDPAATCNNTSVTTSLSSAQVGTAGSFSPGQHVTIARSENLLMSFKSVVSGLKFSLQTEGIESAVFHPLGDEAIVGDITISMSDNTPVVTSMSNTSSEITLVPEGGEFEVGKDYYFEFAPFTAASGFEVIFYKGNQQASFTYNSSRAFARNKFTSIADIDTRLGEWTIRQGNIQFEDANFKAYCVENFDTDGDGEISFDEATIVTSMELNTDNIKSIVGIKGFRNLQDLSATGSGALHIQGLLSSGTGFTSNLPYPKDGQTVATGQLQSADLSGMPELRQVSLRCNMLDMVNVSNCTKLYNLDVSFCNIKEIYVGTNTSLMWLQCDYNQLTSLDASKNYALTSLTCSSNHLTSIEVIKNTALTNFYCGNNLLTSLDVSKNSALVNLSCGNNLLTSLDVSNNTALTDLFCDNNLLTCLDVSNNTALEYLYCNSNQLRNLDVSNNSELSFLWCQLNPFLSEIWLKPDQIINTLNYDSSISTIRYKDSDSKYVDLGLSVKWATCNLGASKPEEYGLYYQWGDTQGYGSDTSDGKYFYWEDDNGNVTYKWCNGSKNTLTKYNTMSSYGPVVDNKIVLDLEDDAVHVAWGGRWRMPTDAEWTELRTNCTWTWTTVNGIDGYRVTSKKSGYTTKSIFLPAAGYRYDGNLYGVSSDGGYWSSSLYTDWLAYGGAYEVFFNSSSVTSNVYNRCNGLSVRPVLE